MEKSASPDSPRRSPIVIIIGSLQIFMAISCIVIFVLIFDMLKTSITLNHNREAFYIGLPLLLLIPFTIYFLMSGIYFVRLSLIGWNIMFFQFISIFIFSALTIVNVFSKIFRSPQNLILEILKSIPIMFIVFISFLVVLYLTRVKKLFK